MDMPPMMTPVEAARVLKIDPDSIRRAIREGRLHARKRDRRWLVFRSSVEGYIHRREERESL